MRIKAPIISTSDIVIAGGTLAACALAIKLGKMGFSVHLATRFCALGEDYCGTFDFAESQSPEYRFLTGDSRVRMPGELKHLLELKLLDSGAEYLYQSYPVAAAEDENGCVSGLVIANRSGFQLLRARVIMDATEYAAVLKAAGLPGVKTGKGKHRISLNVIGQPGMDAERLPFDAVDGGKMFPVFRCSREIQLETGDAAELTAHEMRMRMDVIHEDLRRQADLCRFDFEEIPQTPTVRNPIVRTVSAETEIVENLLAEIPQREITGIRGHSCAHIEIVRRDRYFRFEHAPSVSFELNTLPELAECDIVVAGAGCGGAAASIAAAREGMRVVCVDPMNLPGGVTTVGRIQGYWHGDLRGFTAELNRAVLNFGKPYGVKPECGGNLHIFPKEWRSWVLMEKSAEAGVQYWFHTLAIGAAESDGTLAGIAVATPWGCGYIRAKAVIDSTGAADIAIAAGGTILETTEEPAVQGAAIPSFLPSRSHSNNDFQFICDHDIFDLTRAFTTAHAVLSAQFDTTALQGTRERRGCLGDVVIQPWDIFSGTRWPDAVSCAKSNYDMHGYAVHPLLLLKKPEQKDFRAEIPWRALLPAGLENIVVTGLGISAHRDALPVIRMQADVQNQGYAAGLGTALAIRAGTTPRSLNPVILQKRLRALDILPETPVAEENSLSETARMFLHPAEKRPEAERAFALHPTTETAALLAFLGSDAGTKQLAEAIRTQEWDEGWNFQGMFQQRRGCSNSVLDALIFALAATGGVPGVVNGKLKDLCMESEFSHIRAVCVYFRKHPEQEAVRDLTRILKENKICHAVRTLKEAASPASPDENDNTLRNVQLKELYLAWALLKCDPESETAFRILTCYRDSRNGHYAQFAGKGFVKKP